MNNKMTLLQYLAINGERALQCDNNNGAMPNPVDNHDRALAIRKDLHDLCMENLITDNNLTQFKLKSARGTKLVFEVVYRVGQRPDFEKQHTYTVIILPRLDKAYTTKILGNNANNTKAMLTIFFSEFLNQQIDSCALENFKHECDYINKFYLGE